MTKTNPLERVKPGFTFQTVFWPNPVEHSPYRFRATHIDRERSPKVILCDDQRIEPGVTCIVRVASVKRLQAEHRGQIVVEYVGRGKFELDDDIFLDPILSRQLQALLESGLNVLLDGPQGCGKTVLSRKLAAALKLEYVFFNCSSIYEATDFIATLQLRATAAGAVETVWVPTDILRAVEAATADPRRRFLVFLDEFNRCREMARNGIMPALDSTRKLYNPLTGTTLLIPNNVQWVAAINNGAQFTGTTSVDPAQLDRFAVLKMDYPPPVEEIRLLQRRYPAVKEAVVRTVVAKAALVRGDRELGLDLSMRATEEACTLLSHPNFVDDQERSVMATLKTSFCGRFAGTAADDSTDAGAVWKKISAKTDQG